MFSQTSSAAELPGSIAAASEINVVLAQHVRDVDLEFLDLAGDAFVDVTEFEALDRAVRVLGDEDEVEHSHEITIDEVAQRGCDVAVELVPRELDDDVVDRPELIDGFAHAAIKPTLGTRHYPVSALSTAITRPRHPVSAARVAESG